MLSYYLLLKLTTFQVHKGSLADMKEAVDKINSEIKSSNKSLPKSPVEKPEYHPVKDIIKDLEKEKKFDSNDDKVIELNKTNDAKNEEKVSNDTQIIPPKPLPRTSRTGSVCETIEDPNSTAKPIARPRTNSCAPVVTSVNPNVPIVGGYKVHLLECRAHFLGFALISLLLLCVENFYYYNIYRNSFFLFD